MKWFEGGVSQAILQSRSEKVVFMVYIEGDNEDSTKMKNVWDDREVSELCCRKNCVGIKINCKSEQFQQFAHFYPVVCIPSTYFIGDNGIPIEIVGGALGVEEFICKVKAAFQVYQKSISGSSSNSSQTVMQNAQATSTQLPETSSSQESFKQPEPPQQNKAEEPPPLTDSDADDIASETVTSMTTSSSQDTQIIEERVQRAQELIEQKRTEKEQELKEKAKSQELQRRKMGQDMARSKQKREEQDMKEHVAKLREEKLKEKAAREAVKQAIARDRAEKESERQREKAQKINESNTEKMAKKTINAEASTSAGVTQNSNTQSSSARIQFRLPDGSCLVNTFNGDDLMEVARQFVTEKTGSTNVVMCTTYPRRQLTEEDYLKTLIELGLTPTSTIIIAPGSQLSSSSGGSGGFGIVGDLLSYLFIPVITVWNALRSFLFGTPSDSRGSYPPSTSNSELPTSEQSSNLRRRNVNDSRAKREGNIHRLRSDDDDENNTWNGNSTQQM